MPDVRPRRSVLYMPGANTRALEKARTLPADALRAPYHRALSVPLPPVITSALDAPDTTAMAQRLAADIASLPARSRPRRAGAKSRAL